MTIDEAIKHAEEVADLCEDSASRYDMTDHFESHMACKDGECAEEHRQLAEWLKDYKRLLAQTRWISVTERLPEEDDEYLCTIQTRSIYANKVIDTYINFCNFMDGGWGVFDDETVIAWMPLPEPYKAGIEV